LLNAGEEGVSALGSLDVLNAHMDSLVDVSVSDLLEDFDSDGTAGNVPDTSGSTVVELEGHTLVDVGIGLNVNNITDLVGGEEDAALKRSVVTELSLEEISCSSAKTVRVWHVYY